MYSIRKPVPPPQTLKLPFYNKPKTPLATPAPQMPSVFEMVTNLAGSAKDIASNAIQTGNVIAGKDKIEYRLGFCNGCEFYLDSNGDGKKDRCSKCGCYMEIKTKFIATKCPVGKW